MVDNRSGGKTPQKMHRILHPFSIYVVPRAESASCTAPAPRQMFPGVQNLFLNVQLAFVSEKKMIN